MINLEKKLGPLRLRAYGLGVNFCANVLALYGLSRVLSDMGGKTLLIAGLVLSAICLAILSTPANDEDKR